MLPEQVFRETYALAKWDPTSANVPHVRFVWVASAEGKARLAELSMPSNGEKIKQAPVAPVTVINFISGHGTDANLFARSPRLNFEEANQIL